MVYNRLVRTWTRPDQVSEGISQDLTKIRLQIKRFAVIYLSEQWPNPIDFLYLPKTRRIEAILECLECTNFMLTVGSIDSDLDKLEMMRKVIPLLDVDSGRSAVDKNKWLYKTAKKMYPKGDSYRDLMEGKHTFLVGGKK